MIGTEKQTAYAMDLIANARAWYGAQKYPSGAQASVAQLMALAALEAVERGDIAAAEVALETAAGWAMQCITVDGETARVNASAVIDTLRSTPRAA